VSDYCQSSVQHKISFGPKRGLRISPAPRGFSAGFSGQASQKNKFYASQRLANSRTRVLVNRMQRFVAFYSIYQHIFIADNLYYVTSSNSIPVVLSAAKDLRQEKTYYTLQVYLFLHG